MINKLIFLRNGEEDFDRFCDHNDTKNLILLNLDRHIEFNGFKFTTNHLDEIVHIADYDYIYSVVPSVLDFSLWWNKEEQKYEIYFVGDRGQLINIHEIYPNIREVNNVQRLYLSNMLEEN